MGRNQSESETPAPRATLRRRVAALLAPGPRRVAISRAACFLYLLVLTWLLLTPRLGCVARWWFLWCDPRAMVIHFTTFAGLGVLVAFSRFPLPTRWLLGLLAVYALGAELLQFLSPPRSPELGDAIANLLGLGAGLAAGEYVIKRQALARSNAPSRPSGRDADS